MGRRLLVAAVAIGAAAATAVAAPPSTVTGPSSSQSPYLVPSRPEVTTVSVLTTGDAPAGSTYRMGGIPDGLGAFESHGGTFTVLMNHELGSSNGIVRAHGSKGAYISKWLVRKRDLTVLSGEDLVRKVYLWSGGGYVAGTTAFNRLCSADLPSEWAFFNPSTHRGYPHRIFMNGEESGSEGRAFAHVVDGPDGGSSYELPYLGKFSWENSVAHPRAGNTTVVVGLDDATPGQVYVYIGEKRSSGNPVERAGLVGGKLYGIKVTGFPTETDAVYPPANTPFQLVDLGDVSGKSGATLETESNAALVTRFQRPEDGAWDPGRADTFYFATTRDTGFPSRLWRLTFADPHDLTKGGTITPVLDGTEGHQMLDNLTVDRAGRVLLQEDPGGDKLNGKSYLAKVWAYYPKTDALVEVAHHDPARFDEDLGGPGFLTGNEESSGIIPAPFLGADVYLADVQAHYTHADPELVQGGQLLALRIPYHLHDRVS